MITDKKEVNSIVMKYLGTPYKFLGKSIEEGLDCINLCLAVSKDFGKEIPNINNTVYSADSYGNVLNAARQDIKTWREVRPKQGALCVFKINGVVKHVGFMLNTNDFIHIMENSKVTVDSLSNVQWSRRFVNCYEYIGDDL